MAVIVKRFRTLGQVRQKVVTELSVVESEGVLKDDLLVRSESKVRKTRVDKKHQYPLRLVNSFWRRIMELNLYCKGMSSGPSLNETIFDLLESALDDEAIVKRVMSKYPDRDQLVIVRSWERG